jgi:hypothetical protein
MSLISFDIAVLSAKYTLNWTFLWILVFFLILDLLEFNLCYFYLNKIEPILNKLAFFEKWLAKARDQNNPWVKRCHKKGGTGLFLAALLTHFLVGISAQVIFKFKKGYLVLVIGHVVRVSIFTPILVYGAEGIKKILKTI